MTNARWHTSGASRVDVRVEADASGVRVEVVDDGNGRAGPHARGSGLGLVGMRERVELLGDAWTPVVGPTAAGRSWPPSRRFERDDPASPHGAARADRRRPRPRAGGPGHDPRSAGRCRGRRPGPRRRRGRAAGPPAAPRRLPARRPDARAGRHRRHGPARGPGRAGAPRRRRHHDVRPRRARPRRSAGRGARVPAQGLGPRPAGSGRARRRGRRRDHRPGRDRPPALDVRLPWRSPPRRAPRRAHRAGGAGAGPARAGADEHRDRWRAVRLAEHGQGARREPDGQARRAEPGRVRDAHASGRVRPGG